MYKLAYNVTIKLFIDTNMHALAPRQKYVSNSHKCAMQYSKFHAQLSIWRVQSTIEITYYTHLKVM
jgi:hypothetical protein